MKKDLQSKPIILGTSIVVLVIVTVFAVAMDECNKHERSNYRSEASACAAEFLLSSCTLYTGTICVGKQGVMLTNGPNTEHYFSRIETGRNGDHAVVAGTVLCGQVYNCRVDDKGWCVASQQAVNPSTGKPIERRVAYYDNDDCYGGG